MLTDPHEIINECAKIVWTAWKNTMYKQGKEIPSTHTQWSNLPEDDKILYFNLASAALSEGARTLWAAANDRCLVLEQENIRLRAANQAALESIRSIA